MLPKQKDGGVNDNDSSQSMDTTRAKFETPKTDVIKQDFSIPSEILDACCGLVCCSFSLCCHVTLELPFASKHEKRNNIHHPKPPQHHAIATRHGKEKTLPSTFVPTNLRCILYLDGSNDKYFIHTGPVCMPKRFFLWAGVHEVLQIYCMCVILA